MLRLRRVLISEGGYCYSPALQQRRGPGGTLKVVLFCGGLGARLGDYSDAIPKPMVRIGNRPIVWHLMKYYAHFGHKEFILCLGHMGEVIKDYFLHYDEWVSNDFIMAGGGRDVEMLNSDIDDWKITFVDTRLKSSVGERLKAVEAHLAGEEVFLANYADGLTDLWLPTYVERFLASDSIAGFLAVHSPQSFHVAIMGEDGGVVEVTPVGRSDIWINGGFFVFKQQVFSYINEGEDLVSEPFARLIKDDKLFAHRYEGFWEAMDTFKDKQLLDALYESNRHAPWEIWKFPPESQLDILAGSGSGPAPTDREVGSAEREART